MNDVDKLSTSKRIQYWLIVAGCGWFVWRIVLAGWLQWNAERSLDSFYMFFLIPCAALVLLVGMSTLKILLFGRSARNRNRYAA